MHSDSASTWSLHPGHKDKWPMGTLINKTMNDCSICNKRNSCATIERNQSREWELFWRGWCKNSLRRWHLIWNLKDEKKSAMYRERKDEFSQRAQGGCWHVQGTQAMSCGGPRRSGGKGARGRSEGSKMSRSTQDSVRHGSFLHLVGSHCKI